LQHGDLELPGELYLMTQVESSTRMSLRKSSFKYFRRIVTIRSQIYFFEAAVFGFDAEDQDHDDFDD
jgi:hypothetical protein